MAFSSQQPAAQRVENAGDLHLGAGSDMLWISEQGFDTNLQSHQTLGLTQQNNAFNFQHEPGASSVIPFSFSSFGNVPNAETGHPFRAPQSQISDFYPYSIDSSVSGRKQKERATLGPQREGKSQGTDWGIQFGAHQFEVSLTE